MNKHYVYFVILAASLAGPFGLSFDKKVAFYTKWKYLFPAMIFPALVYLGWDIYFTSKGVWSFNSDYITGVKLANLPVEEVLFFFIVPYCCVFIYECVCCYFPASSNRKFADSILKWLAIFLLIAGIVFNNKSYTACTFIFLSFFIAFIYTRSLFFKDFNAAFFLPAFAIILIPFLIINGLLTAMPVVLYNDKENSGIKIYTIPFEDVFYGMLLVLMNVTIFEKLRNRKSLTVIDKI